MTPTRNFKKTFAVKGEVNTARLYICGLGLFEAYINGRKAGNDLLAPFINDYEEHFQYCTYDVIDLLNSENEISVLLGDG
jgi:alpha-L-rhamnosidase